MAYPSDSAGMAGGRFVDDGRHLRLEPPGITSGIMVAFYVLMLAWNSIALFLPPRHNPPLKSDPAGRVCVIVAIILTDVLITACFWGGRSTRREPWLIVDRQSSRIILPRENRSLAFKEVVRLQLVSVTPPKALSVPNRTRFRGELQIIFFDAGRETTWCVAGGLSTRVLRRFIPAFSVATGVPVSRVRAINAKEFSIEPALGSTIDP